MGLEPVVGLGQVVEREPVEPVVGQEPVEPVVGQEPEPIASSSVH